MTWTLRARVFACVVLLVPSGLFLVSYAQTTALPPASTFRSGVELVQLDVSVLDRDRRAVRGLGPNDFTVTVDGRRQAIVAFKEIVVPPPAAPPTAPWMREIDRDVATNTQAPGRVVAILVDDYSFGDALVGAGGIANARRTAEAVLDTIGPDDRAAVLFTSNGQTSQAFTTNQTLLRHAISRAPLFSDGEGTSEGVTTGAGPTSEREENGSCFCGVCSIEALGQVGAALRRLPDQRKVVVYISAGSVVLPPRGRPSPCQGRRWDAMHEALRQLQIANVTVHAVDPQGLVMGRVDMNRKLNNFVPYTPQQLLDEPAMRRVEFLRTFAESTGGRAVVNTNDMAGPATSLLQESSGYYLLGVEPLAPLQPGRFRPVRVRVSRSGTEVRTRSGYYDLTERDRQLAAAADDTGLSTLIASPLPKAGLPLALATAAVATADGTSELVVALAAMDLSATGGTPGHAEFAVSLFNASTGEPVARRAEEVELEPHRQASGPERAEIVTRLAAPPGRYEVRAAVRTSDNRSASVYGYAEISAIHSGRLSASDLLVTTRPPGSPGDVIIPTARRAFRAGEFAAVVLQIYEIDAPVTAVVSVIDTRDVIVSRQTHTLQATAPTRSAELRVELPLDGLAPGEYAVSVDVAHTGAPLRRSTRIARE